MAWNSFSYVENQGEITGKSFRTQTEQAINDIAKFAESAIELGIGDAAEKAGELATEKAIEAVKSTAVLTEPQTLELEKRQQARANIGLASVVTSVNSQQGDVVIDLGVESFNGQKGEITYSAPVQSVNGATGAVTSEQLGCLLSTGGTVTGNIDLGSNSVVLNGKGLYGSSRGLVYGDKVIPVTDSYITETWHSGANWYRVWSDGWIEQGGFVARPSSGVVNVSLFKRINTKTVSFSTGDKGTSIATNTCSALKNLSSTTAEIMVGASPSASIYWSISAYGA